MKIMRNIIIIFLLTIVNVFTMQADNYGVFIPDAGEFKWLNIPDSIDTIDKISTYLGYESGKHYIYLNTDYKDIDCIIFKVFSEDIIAVLSDYSGSTLPKRIINRYLVDYNYFVEYNAYFWESDLDNAINNRLYSKEFMREVLHLPFKQYKTQINSIKLRI